MNCIATWFRLSSTKFPDLGSSQSVFSSTFTKALVVVGGVVNYVVV